MHIFRQQSPHGISLPSPVLWSKQQFRSGHTLRAVANPRWVFARKILKSPLNGSRDCISYPGMSAEVKPTCIELFCMLRASNHHQMTTHLKYIQHVLKVVISRYLDITGYGKNDFSQSKKSKNKKRRRGMLRLQRLKHYTK